MCDKGFLDDNPNGFSLNGHVRIKEDLIKEGETELSKLLGFTVALKWVETSDTIRILNKDRILYHEPQVVGTFSLDQLPGCCGSMISYHTFIYSPYRGKGVGQYLLKFKEKIAREDGYSNIIATTTSGNGPEIHNLEKNGWVKINSFLNKRTGNTVLTWTKNLAVE